MINLTRRKFMAGAAATATACFPTVARAAWPNRPITLVHGFGAGGNADILARILSDRLLSLLGQSIVVEARPGAGGTTAALQVSRASPDGYTLLMVVGGHSIAPALYQSLPFDPIGDFTFITSLAEYPFVLSTYPDHPVKTPWDLITEAKTRSEPMTFGSAGNGTTQHLAMELLAAQAGIKLQHVPYRGNTFGVSDLMAKRIDFMIEAPASTLSSVKSGKVRPVGVTSSKGFFALPEVPSLADAVPGYDVMTWSGLGGPPGLPAEVIEKINSAVRAALAQPDVVEKIHTLGNEPAWSTPDSFRTRVATDIGKWTRAVRAAGIPKI